ncbi:hypothetical protein FRC08_009505 [Ceratobasidium sp. 394]|nr:hypothetical protein FRC08_009505 [Ceratobasidium sp. 394]
MKYGIEAVRINTLPPEILALVFTFSRSCSRITKKKLVFYDFAAVCAYWRRVALDTPVLWSHVDVGPNTPEGLTQLLLERSKDVSIDVHAFEPGPPPDYPRTTEEEVDRTIDILAPHIHRVRGLEVESYSFYLEFITSVTKLWLDNSGVCPPRSLVMRIRHACLPRIPHPQRAGSNLLQSENARRVLRSLDTLHLLSVDFGWNSGAYRDLVDLRLIIRGYYVGIYLSEFAEILSTSPTLAILKLDTLDVRHPKGQSQPAPRSMKYLSVLNLLHMNPSSLKLLLPLIDLRDSLTETSIAVSVTGQIHNELEAFLLHSRVTMLYYSHRDDSPSLWSTLLHSFHLRTLIVSPFQMRGPLAGEAIPPHPQQQPFSRPPRVILRRSNVSFEGLKNLIASHGIRELCLEECEVPTEGHHDLHEIRNLLMDTFPELECKVSDTDSTRDLPCCTMFERGNWMSVPE